MQDPDESPPSERQAPGLPPASRRTLLGHAVATATLGYLWLDGLPDPFRRARVVPTAPGETPQFLTPGEWATLGAAQARLLPSAEGSPGARDVNAIGHLDAALGAPDVEGDVGERVREGARRLDDYARDHGADHYAALGGAEQDEALRSLEAVWEDELILRALLAFTLEALLGDPVHGVNPEGKGWAWAAHRPGYPRPQGTWAPVGEGPRGKGDR